MRALTVIAEMGTGGAESVVADLAGHLVATGHEACVASNGGWRADALAADGVATLAVPLRASGPTQLARAVARLRRETAARPVDVVHAHNVRASLAAHLGTRAGRRSRPPLVTTVHGLADGDYTRAARLLAVSDLVVAVSDDVADRLTAGGLDPARLRVIENAVPPPVADPAVRAEVRAELGLTSKPGRAVRGAAGGPEAGRPAARCLGRGARCDPAAGRRRRGPGRAGAPGGAARGPGAVPRRTP